MGVRLDRKLLAMLQTKALGRAQSSCVPYVRDRQMNVNILTNTAYSVCIAEYDVPIQLTAHADDDQDHREYVYISYLPQCVRDTVRATPRRTPHCEQPATD